MKKVYIIPAIKATSFQSRPMLTAALSKHSFRTNTADYSAVSEDYLDVDNNATSITMSGNERNDFGSESGPWDSLW